MEQVSPVKVTIVKKRRRRSQRSVKSESNSTKVTRVKSVIKKTMVVENVDTISMEYSSLSLNKKIERPPTTISVTRISHSQSLKSMTDQPSLQQSDRSEHHLTQSSKPHTVIPIQKKELFNSNIENQLVDFRSTPSSKSNDAKINCSSSEFDTDDRREIYTIGKDRLNKNKKSQLCQKCSVRYYLGIGLTLIIMFGVIVALPVTMVSTLITTTMISTTSTTVALSTTITVSTTTSTTATTASTTSVTTTTAAATVTITSNVCTSGWKGITMIYHCDSCSQRTTYASLSFNYVAIANVTRISYALRRDAGYFGIDDVSIRDTAAPANELLSNGGFENGNFSSWAHCFQTGSPSIGSVESTASGISYGAYTFAALSGNYYYLGGATVNAEYLSQTFPSIIGHTYIFSFSYVYVGSGSLSSGDFLLSI